MKAIFFLLISINSFFLSGCEKSGTCSPGCDTVQCSATTQAGARCQNRTTNCCGRCYLHV